MKFNWEQTQNLLGIQELACVSAFNPSVGCMGRWFCPPSQAFNLAARVELLVSSSGTDYEVKIWMPNNH